MTDYEKVIDLKKKLENEIGDYSSYFLYDLVKINNIKIKSNLKKLIFKVNFNSKFMIQSSVYTTNYIDTLKRKDHSQSNQKLKKLLKANYNIQEDEVYLFKLDFNIIYNILKVLYTIYKINKKINNINNSINIAFCLLEYDKNKKIIEKRLKKIAPKLVLTFCDILPLENQITLIAKKNGIKTVTLQHGQYFYYNDENKPIHSLTLSEMQSDYFLTWGEYTLNQALKYGKNTDGFIKVGTLKNIDDKNERLTIDKKKDIKNVVGIIFDNNLGIESNKNMLNLVSKFCRLLGYKYIIRLHPTNNIDDYKNHIDKKLILDIIRNLPEEKYINMIDFSISHLSSMCIELLKYNHKTFIFKDSYSNVDLDLEKLEFRNLEELKLKLRQSISIDCQKEYSKFIENQANTKENYLLALKKMINSEEDKNIL
ncbi:hypothetical protein [Cetobacterium sp.]|uniref:hypothetical protein n=1 Tax=Cetobacterium sp. TaxID=2071632 RepID=UPI003F3444E1